MVMARNDFTDGQICTSDLSPDWLKCGAFLAWEAASNKNDAELKEDNMDN
jgi:hypothetical protein